MEKLEEIVVVQATSEWLKNPETLDFLRKQPVMQYEKLPSLSVQPEVAVAVKFLKEPRETTGRDGQAYAFADLELVEGAVLYTKEKGQFEAPAGTKATMNLKRHAALYRNTMKLAPLTGKELVIANLGKRTFKTDKAPRGTATGYDYRVMLLADLKAKMGKK